MPRGGVFYSKISFTLSEVLITLVIIGIISAVTIPFIIANYQEQERIAKARKMYSTLANAMTYVKAEGGDFIFSVLNSGNEQSYNTLKNWFNTYLTKYLNINKICYNEQGCWTEDNVYQLNGVKSGFSKNGIGFGTDVISFILSDGTFVSANAAAVSQELFIFYGFNKTVPEDMVILTFDINGSKKPNVIGKDIFITLFTESGFVPAFKDATSEEINESCSPSGNGHGCLMKYLSK